MKKFLVNLALFAAIVILLDIAVGVVMPMLAENAKGGATWRKNYIVNRSDEDILIFGSSRAYHHYNPAVIDSVLGVRSYNCGFRGNGIICAYGFYKLMSKRRTPPVILYELTPGYDLLANDNHTYLEHLRPYYDDPDVRSVINAVDSLESVKMRSNMYRFNSIFLVMLMDNIKPMQNDAGGFSPMNGLMSSEAEAAAVNRAPEKAFAYDPLKLHYLEALMRDCRDSGTRLVVTLSPEYGRTDDSVIAPARELCRKYGVPLLNHYTDTAFTTRSEYFSDPSHLNRLGSAAFTRTIAHSLIPLLP